MLKNKVTKQHPFVLQSASLPCHNVLTLDATKVQKETHITGNHIYFLTICIPHVKFERLRIIKLTFIYDKMCIFAAYKQQDSK